MTIIAEDDVSVTDAGVDAIIQTALHQVQTPTTIIMAAPKE